MIDQGWVAGLATLLGAFALTPLLRAYALSRNLVDHPGPRRSHHAPVPRGGGLAVAIALIAGTWIALPPVPPVAMLAAGAAVISVLGWIEDHCPVRIGLRLFAEAVTAAAAVLWLGPVTVVNIAGLAVDAAWLWTPLAVVAIVWLINLFNFMDGADGLASVQTIISSVLFAGLFAHAGAEVACWMAILVAAATAGFAYWNWPPASIFLGDAGSLLLGWCIGLLALLGAVDGTVSVWTGFIVVSPFAVDATATLGWRIARGERWYTPHRDHAYQRLIRAGWSHGAVVLAWTAANALLVVPAALIAARYPRADLALAALLGLVLFGVWYVVQFVLATERGTA